MDRKKLKNHTKTTITNKIPKKPQNQTNKNPNQPSNQPQ